LRERRSLLMTRSAGWECERFERHRQLDGQRGNGLVIVGDQDGRLWIAEDGRVEQVLRCVGDPVCEQRYISLFPVANEDISHVVLCPLVMDTIKTFTVLQKW
jgi:hypothetical protein